jgi:hypothetical protein
MRELEQKFAEWRARANAALPGQPETVGEIEEHLRDHVAALMQKGVEPLAAFAAAVKRLGEPETLAREFGRVGSGWLPTTRPILGLLVFVAISTVAVTAFLSWVLYAGKMTPLLFFHVVTATAGYYAVAAMGLLGAWALLTPFWRPLSATERREARRSLWWLAIGSGVLVPVGMMLGMIWAADHLGRAWGWDPKEVGGVLVLLSSWLVLFLHPRRTVSDRTLWWLAIVGGLGVDLQLASWAFAAVVPAWICVTLIAAQVAVAVLGKKEVNQSLV